MTTGSLNRERVLRQTHTENSQLREWLARVPSVVRVPLDESRRLRREGDGGLFKAPVFVDSAQKMVIAGPGGPLTLRIIAPGVPPAGVFMHIHGGGWTLGGSDLQDLRLQALAEGTGLTVVSVEYRLAPEHPYPAAPDDCEAAALWLLSAAGRSLLGISGPMAIGGDSAGAHLSVVTLLRLRDRHSIIGAFGAAVLEYGAYDLSQSPSQRLWDKDFVLSPEVLAWYYDNFLPTLSTEERRAPSVSPLFDDLAHMPPAFFTVGTNDPLLDDTLFMETRWRAAGHQTELQIWSDAPHGFMGLGMTVGNLTAEAEQKFARGTLGRP